ILQKAVLDCLKAAGSSLSKAAITAIYNKIT
uniref:Dicynthaurin n=1 Tax=Halocynthia aurantium TaxID=254849 RepID=CYNT_HALAU|nr:RecName: Full=Dicynthaurin [Halocynthia aurantium]